MSSKRKVFIRTIMLTIALSGLVINMPTEYKAETTGITKKTILIKTAELKVDKKIVAEGLKTEEEETRNEITDLAYEQLGYPYVWGGTGPNGFDCSGLVTYVFSSYGVYLPRTSESQYYAGTQVSMDELIPGDLVFFDTYGSLSHVGIYVGDGSFVHASTTSVIVSSIYESYYSSTYAGAVRVLQ